MEHFHLVVHFSFGSDSVVDSTMLVLVLNILTETLTFLSLSNPVLQYTATAGRSCGDGTATVTLTWMFVGRDLRQSPWPD